MKMQKLLSLTRKAVDDYKMINDNDKIAIGISGGKDSLTLLHALSGLQIFYPKKFELEAISVDLGFSNIDFTKIKEMCDKLGVRFTVVKTDIGRIVFDERKEKNPCSLCAKMRKGALNDAAKDMGCNKIAYGHHKDDIVETMLMSLIYEGRLHTFQPNTYLDRMQMYVIRPLMYCEEREIIGFVNQNQLPVVKSPCPANGYTKREYASELLEQINKETEGVKSRIFTAIQNSLFI